MRLSSIEYCRTYSCQIFFWNITFKYTKVCKYTIDCSISCSYSFICNWYKFRICKGTELSYCGEGLIISISCILHSSSKRVIACLVVCCNSCIIAFFLSVGNSLNSSLNLIQFRQYILILSNRFTFIVILQHLCIQFCKSCLLLCELLKVFLNDTCLVAGWNLVISFRPIFVCLFILCNLLLVCCLVILCISANGLNKGIKVFELCYNRCWNLCAVAVFTRISVKSFLLQSCEIIAVAAD